MEICRNLKAEMVRKNITSAAVAELLNVSERTVRAKIKGETDFTWGEVQTIKKQLFPDINEEYLFERQPPDAGREYTPPESAM